MNVEEFLPNGSVVLLKGGIKPIMITGYCVIPNENQHKMYTYCGYPHPEGCIDTNEICMFNHNQIEKVLFRGYEDENQKIFSEELKEAAKNIIIDDDNNIVSDNLSDNINEMDVFQNTSSFSINNSIFN